VIWIQHAHDQPAVAGLEAGRERKSWAGYAFVSQWQLDCFVAKFWVPAERSRVMRNAVAPRFAELPPTEPWYVAGKAPVLIYSSQPYRGLDVLLDAWPAIRAAIPDARLKVLSGFAATYRTDLAADPHAHLYRRCMASEGVDYVGPIAQPLLAGELSAAAALAYPSIFAETSCISALEAMAAGAKVLTTKLGALAETTAGHAALIDFVPDRARLAQDFAAMAVEQLKEMRYSPQTAMARRDAQIAYVRQHYTWRLRALEWQAWLREIAGC
jgi:glycosyltransferase involved in cell wall biosynthesis